MLVKFVEEHSPGSAANFNFAATAMLAPYAPFYPPPEKSGCRASAWTRSLPIAAA